MDAPRPGRCQLDEVGDRARAALLRHPDQTEQNLRRRLRVGQRTVARSRVRRETVRERSKVRRLPAEQAASRARRCRRRWRQTRRPVARIVSLSRNAMSKRALCATRTASAAKPRNRRTAAWTGGARHSSASRSPVRAAIAGSRRAPGLASVWKRSSSASARTRTAPISHGRAAPGRSPVVSRSKTTNVACSSASASLGALSTATRSPAQRRRASARTASSSSDRAEPDRDLRAELEDEARRLVCRHRPASLLDELDESVGGVETELHPSDASANICSCLGGGPTGECQTGQQLAHHPFRHERGDVRRADAGGDYLDDVCGRQLDA